MPGFAADPVLLHHAADRLTQGVDDFTDQPSLRFWAQPTEAGDPSLAAALEHFQQASTAGSALLVADVRRLSGRLHEARRLYVRFDADAAEVIKTCRPGPAGASAASTAPESTSVIQAVLG
jgi:hypothetical protein